MTPSPQSKGPEPEIVVSLTREEAEQIAFDVATLAQKLPGDLRRQCLRKLKAALEPTPREKP